MDISIVIAAVVLYLVHAALLERRLLVSERREKSYLAMIKSLENRLTAKDLSGYMALQGEDAKAAKPAQPQFVPRNDVEEAMLEQMRYGNGMG